MSVEISRSNPGQRGNTPFVPSWMQEQRMWVIKSSFDLPLRMKRLFSSYTEAYAMACEWNRCHDAKDMAWPEEVQA